MLNTENSIILVSVYLVGYAVYKIYYTIGLYHFNPFLRLKPLQPKEESLIADNFPIYSKLPTKLKEKCNNRIIWYRSRKKFVFYGTNSRINRRHHLGEYNPHFKTVIFSADKIWEGFEIVDDNINLAMHEFAHALTADMMKKNSWQARRFRVGLKKMKQLFLQEAFVKKVAEAPYFREYGMTNLQEFFSVAVENYVETPVEFLNQYPQLYAIIKRMLNFDFQDPPTNKTPGVFSI